ncbi:bifunctional diguanylate cyclase/phosphodiesterase [Chroococcus sp. FPU101]|uniref:putative bifunctional diguanylate cyclase/phosphodiesterase n=1 Tax=Chroococcus sp. FPU101 TaxID=1974212 RepID=UPI001F5CA15E|nr:EAL domain-containing protein [Chroococcus sp. FPU101]
MKLPEDTLLLSKNGAEIPIGDSAAPIIDDQENVIGAVLVFWDMTEQRKVREQLSYQAFHDALTGLPNRLLFIDRLTQAIERLKRHQDTRFAVLFLDLDRFKLVNDSLGHPIGDQLLIAIAARLEGCLRASDTIARLGGDEFAILLEDIQDVSDACRAAERIIQELNVPFNLDAQQVFTTVSIGIVLGFSHHDQVEDLLRNADIAMYRAKALGKARYEVFDAIMHAQAKALLQLENDLRRAMDNCEFEVYYQPIISLSTNKLIGFEALVRWRHPKRGLISPAEFIPIAEETGLILEIDLWVLQEACYQTQLWQQQFANFNQPLTISVNLSSKHFTRSDLVEQILQVLEETGLNASSLKLEITETVIIDNPESATTILAQLKALGIGLSIDDFGTGYSSLSYLHRFPFDIMKIDRFFINRLDKESESLEIVRTIMMLAQNLSMVVIAEGVETSEQLNKLQELRCEYAQGYFFAPPLSQDAAESLIMRDHQ